MTVLSLTEVSAQTGNFALVVPQWFAEAGEFSVLLGRNGAGKSTLLKVIASEIPSEGSVSLHGQPGNDWHAMERARHVAVLPQVSELNFAFRAEEVVALGATPLDLGWRALADACRRFMTMTDCQHLADKPYPQLSGGEKQRVHLARVLLQLSQAEREPLLLLDEPTSAQDLRQQHLVLDLARDLCHRQDYAVVAVLHDLNQALRYSDQCTLLDGGRIVATGRPDLLLTPTQVNDLWKFPVQYARTASGHQVLC